MWYTSKNLRVEGDEKLQQENWDVPGYMWWLRCCCHGTEAERGQGGGKGQGQRGHGAVRAQGVKSTRGEQTFREETSNC